MIEQQNDRDKPAIVPLRFWKDHEPVAGRPGEFQEIEYVEWAKKGSNGATTIDKVARLAKRGSQGQGNPAWAVIEPYYQAWKKGQDAPVNGTPLDVLAFLTKGQVDHLRLLNLRSAEDLAGATDADLERIGMGARALREKARAYVEAKKGAALMAEQTAGLRQENEELRAQIAELSKSMEALTANMPKRQKPADAAQRASG